MPGGEGTSVVCAGFSPTIASVAAGRRSPETAGAAGGSAEITGAGARAG